MHVITVNLLLFLFVVVLPVLSFLRHNRAFRGGAQDMVRFTQRQKAREAAVDGAARGSPPAATTGHRRHWRRIALRMTFALMLAAPVNYVVYTNLRRLARYAGSAESLCATQRWLQQVGPWLPSLATFALPKNATASDDDGAVVRLCARNWGVQCLAWGLCACPHLFLALALLIDVGYVLLFYIDGREYGLQTRHNDNRLNRAINFIKFRYYLPYVNWKCRIVRNYFSIELVASDGPLPLFRYPTSENMEKVRVAHQRRAERAGATSGAGDDGQPDASAVDDWDEEERAALASQAHQAAQRPHLPLSAWAHVSDQSCVSGTAAEEADEQTADSSPEAVMECTRYLFAAHPHGILPLCALVALVSNVTDRNRILFVDNRSFTAESVKATLQERGTVDGGAITELCSRSASSSDGLLKRSVPSDTARAGANDGSPVAAALPVRRFTTTNTRHLSPAASRTAVISPTVSPRLSPSLETSSSPLQAQPPVAPSPAPPADTGAKPNAPRRRPYARGRHYVYDKELATFRLMPTRDETVPPAGLRVPSPSPQFGDRVRTRLRAVVATFPFFIPIMREIYLFQGMLDASYASCRRVLESNIHPVVQKMWGWGRRRRRPSPSSATPTVMDHNSLLLFPGGASEALLSSAKGPARILLRRRKGFVRLALQTGSGLVPCYTFGETDYYDQYGTHNWRDAAAYEDDDSVVWGHHNGRDTTAEDSKGASTYGHAPQYYRDVIPSASEEDTGTSPTSSLPSTKQASSPPTRPSSAEHASTTASSSSRKPPRWVQLFQRYFQDTFGISFPLLRNLVPHRCKAATVVGRPLFFELPPDLARMYTDPAQFYDAQTERAVVAAAQEVYMRELKALFDQYAPVYLADHKRRRLVVV